MKPKSNATAKRKGKAAVTITLPVPITVALDKLVLSDANVRKLYDEESIADLADSIARRGLLQSLSIRAQADADGKHNGIHEVQAGGRRYRALNLLVAEGRLAADAAIACILKTDGSAADDSLAENSDRVNLHPVDEFRAFTAMKADGMNDEAIAAAYRVTPAFVRQRLRLAAASPVLLQAFVDEDLELQQLMAFCLTEDHARQEAVYESLKDSYMLNQTHVIRQRLTEDAIRIHDARVTFVGLEAYENAGGPVLRDLFEESNQYIRDPDLLNRMVSEKLDALRQEYLDKGWGWAEAALSIPYNVKQGMDRLVPTNEDLTAKDQKQLEKLEAERDRLWELEEPTDEQSTRLDAVENEIEAIENRPPVFRKKDMAGAGVFISLNHNGEVDVDYGFVKPDNSAETGTPDTAAVNGAVDADDGEEPETDEAGQKAKPLSDSLVQDLTSFRTIAMRNAMAQDFDTAFIAVLHALVLGQFYQSSYSTCLQITTTRSFPSSAQGLDTWDTTKAVDKRNAYWKKQLPKSQGELWGALVAMDRTDRQALFAHCAAGTLNAVKSKHTFRSDALEQAEQLVSALGMNMTASGWTTRADNYFSRVTKPNILAAVAEAKGEQTANLISHMKKDTMAIEAERLIAGTGWLPEVLRARPTGTEAETTESDTNALPAFLASDGNDVADTAA